METLCGLFLPLIEIATWIGVMIWIIKFVYTRQDFTVLILLGVLFLLFVIPIWFLLRDFLYGLILKLQRKIEVHKIIDIEGLKGEILKTGYFSFDILTEKGSIDTVPYNRIIAKVVSVSSENANLAKIKLTFKIPETHGISFSRTKLEEVLLNCPFVANSQKPVLGSVYTENDAQKIDVYVLALNKEYSRKIQEYVEYYFKDIRPI